MWSVGALGAGGINFRKLGDVLQQKHEAITQIARLLLFWG